MPKYTVHWGSGNQVGNSTTISLMLPGFDLRNRQPEMYTIETPSTPEPSGFPLNPARTTSSSLKSVHKNKIKVGNASAAKHHHLET